MKREVSSFIDRYVKEIRDSSAAVFIGAGFSKSSGYVDWKNLLRSIAYELDLDVDKEYDLVSLAQYSYNKNRNRSIINDVIFDEFSLEKEIDENHKILSRLPIFTYWTTNYDSLIEDALKEAQRVVDVKYNNKQLSITKPHRDAIVYKMHGDKNNPDDAIIIKDDYEKYYHEHAQFITALSGDLISKTFLFIGFSFSDPNIDYILSRIRIDYGEENRRQHYALMRKIQQSDFQEKADYEYASRKHELFIDDLNRYNIKALMLDDYAEITHILREIYTRLNYNNIFISGSATEYGDFDEKEALQFIHLLSNRLIRQEFNLISGFGLGVGSSVITGALEEIYMKRKTINEDRLLLRPFPQGIENEHTRNMLWASYREDMISRAGISIFVFGNKFNDKTNQVVLANGMRSEFEIACKCNNLIIPVGCTGYIAQEIWTEIHKDLEKFYPNVDQELISAFDRLNCKTNIEDTVNNIVEFIRLLRRN
ncbi:MAG: SIR2 family protein [Lachnospiraceae bacterium]|nr:SIR2 family protein [Lachnospiraceae bacterium]